MNIAVLLYHSTAGRDTITYRTTKTSVRELPKPNNALILHAGAFEPDIGGTESAEWIGVYPFHQLPDLDALRQAKA